MRLTLYFFPGACSRVTMTALEEIGLDYADHCVNIRSDQQKAADYLTVNPKAKVPALDVDGRIMTENAVILHVLDRRFSQALLLPHDADPVRDAQGLIDLVWCASTLHPAVRQVRAPDKYTTGDPAPVRADGMAKLGKDFPRIAAQIGEGWWYGERWSILDTYLYWLGAVAERGGYPIGDHPQLLAHAARVRARPAFQRALAREKAAAERLGIEDVRY